MRGAAEKQNELGLRVGDDEEVEVTLGKLVNFIYDDKLGACFCKACFPSVDTPALRISQLEQMFPLGSELGGWDDDLEVF